MGSKQWWFRAFKGFYFASCLRENNYRRHSLYKKNTLLKHQQLCREYSGEIEGMYFKTERYGYLICVMDYYRILD